MNLETCIIFKRNVWSNFEITVESLESDLFSRIIRNVSKIERSIVSAKKENLGAHFSLSFHDSYRNILARIYNRQNL